MSSAKSAVPSAPTPGGFHAASLRLVRLPLIHPSIDGSLAIFEPATRADHSAVEYVHACAFCGWGREDTTAIVLPPGCPACGCAVDSMTRAEFDAAVPAPPARRATPRSVRALGVLLAVAFLCAAARGGYQLGGVNGAITAVGFAGYALLPFMPRSIGDMRPAGYDAV